MIKEIQKEYRTDLGMWESTFAFFFLRFYGYAVYTKGMLITKKSLFKIKSRSAKYFKFAGNDVKWRITKEQFKTEYNGNKVFVTFKHGG